MTSVLKLGKEFRQAVVARRPANQADVRRALEDPFAFLLRHAAQHGEHPALPAVPLNCCRRL
jgi:hypothetical protein